jgi:hypothetical protein
MSNITLDLFSRFGLEVRFFFFRLFHPPRIMGSNWHQFGRVWAGKPMLSDVEYL